jgi:hypothetical protein
MPQVVEPHLADAGALQRPLEAFADLASLERMPGVRMGEHEVVLGLVGGGLEEQLELAADVVGHRHRSA